MQNLVREFTYSLRRFSLVILLTLVLVYIFYHMTSGERGLATWLTLSDEIETLQQENALLQAEVDAQRKIVDRLSLQKPDKDYLDELVRKNLALARPEEKIIIVPKTEQEK